MDNRLNKIASIFLYVLMGVSALLTILFYTGIITESPFIIWAYFLFGIAVTITLAFAVIQVFGSAKSMKRALMSIGILILLVFISWLLASPEIPTFTGIDKFNLTHVASRNIGTGLYMVYILAIIAIGSMIYSEVANIFR